MILALFVFSSAFADDTNVQRIIDLSGERDRLVAEIAKDQARVDQITGELDRLKGQEVLVPEAPPAPSVPKQTFQVIVVGPSSNIAQVLNQSAVESFMACEGDTPFPLAGTFTLNNGVVQADSYRRDDGNSMPFSTRQCLGQALRQVAFDRTFGQYGVNFVLQ